MKIIEVFIILCGLFYFSEGKPCPEKTRPHKSRCEIYYKCTQLSSKAHVWVPENCEQGLVYEHELKMCVLPGDDWECTLGDKEIENTDSKAVVSTTSSNQNVQGSSSSSGETIATSGVHDYSRIDNNVELIGAGEDLSSEEEDYDVAVNTNGRIVDQMDNAREDDDQIEASGDGGELGRVEDEGFLNAENRESQMPLPERQALEHETINEQEHLSSSKIDPTLTAHLQRLSQLIDGLKQTYQSQDQKQMEMRPDQLNAFLAHFDIKNSFDNLALSDRNKSKDSIAQSMEKVADLHRYTNQSQNALLNKLQPETKIGQINTPVRLYPEATQTQFGPAVTEATLLPSPLYQSYGHKHEHDKNEPKISEETLRRVLDLSNQMIATQNIPKVIPNPSFVPQPIYQPLFISPPAFGDPFSAYFGAATLNNNNGNKQTYNNNGADYAESGEQYVRPTSLSHSQITSHANKQRPSTTIIHNNVIPVHLSATSSGEKELLDSYGQSLGTYPPLSHIDSGNKNNYQQQTISHHHVHSHHFENNQYVTEGDVTTMRPTVMITTTPANQYSGQYPSPYPSEMSATTPRPTKFVTTPATIAEYYTPSPHLSENNIHNLFPAPERYPTIQYANLPRPMDFNRPNSAAYRPTDGVSLLNGMFPTLIDPNKVHIQPNAYKVESMEVENDEHHTTSTHSHNPYTNSNSNNNNNNNDYMQALGLSLSSGLSSNSFSSNNAPNPNKNSYLSRPSLSSSGSGSGSLSSGSSSIFSNKPKYPHTSGGYPEGTQLVNIGGNFIKYDIFQSALAPALNGMPNVEVITCATGVRQPNTTDCTRYYVCSKKDGKVLSYSCPPYTAFNSQTRICDARTYSLCNPEAMMNTFTVAENKRIQLEALKAMQEANRRREQAIKTQAIANLLQQFSPSNHQAIDDYAENNDDNVLNSYIQQAAAMGQNSGLAVSSTPKPLKKRKYYCKEGDKIADQTSTTSYFVCYKNSDGVMKGKKMICSKGLIFCAKSTMCTLPVKCSF